QHARQRRAYLCNPAARALAGRFRKYRVDRSTNALKVVLGQRRMRQEREARLTELLSDGPPLGRAQTGRIERFFEINFRAAAVERRDLKCSQFGDDTVAAPSAAKPFGPDIGIEPVIAVGEPLRRFGDSNGAFEPAENVDAGAGIGR